MRVNDIGENVERLAVPCARLGKLEQQVINHAVCINKSFQVHQGERLVQACRVSLGRVSLGVLRGLKCLAIPAQTHQDVKANLEQLEKSGRVWTFNWIFKIGRAHV